VKIGDVVQSYTWRYLEVVLWRLATLRPTWWYHVMRAIGAREQQSAAVGRNISSIFRPSVGAYYVNAHERSRQHVYGLSCSIDIAAAYRLQSLGMRGALSISGPISGPKWRRK